MASDDPTPLPEQTLATFEASLHRCFANEGFLDRFYERFLGSGEEVRAKFAATDFVRQKRALRASFHLILLAASEGAAGRETYLKDVAIRHGRRNLDVGSGLYDLWLDSLLAVVVEFDPLYRAEVSAAWEQVMGVGIEYMLRHYHDAQGGPVPD